MTCLAMPSATSAASSTVLASAEVRVEAGAVVPQRYGMACSAAILHLLEISIDPVPAALFAQQLTTWSHV